MTDARMKLLLVVGAVLAFLLLIGLEAATEEDAISLADFGVDAIAMFLTVACAASLAALFVRGERQREERDGLLSDLDAARRDGAEWRAAVDHHVNGVKGAIAAQFENWAMTPAERDVALMILKGLSHKEIAALRQTSEATVRQQAQAIYRKSGLAGKAALTAYFLEDMLSGAGGSGATGASAHPKPNGRGVRQTSDDPPPNR